jgi:hypothetical protein
MTSNENKFIPYEKTHFSNFNGGCSINIPKWDATGEYFDAVPDAVPSTKLPGGIRLLKNSSFNKIGSVFSTLMEDTNLNIKGLIKVSYGNNNVLVGTESSSTHEIKINSPIIDFNGFSVETIGDYLIELSHNSIIKVAKGETILLEGLNDSYLKVKLEEEFIGNFVAKIEIKKEIKKDVEKEVEIKHEKVILTKDFFNKLTNNLP